MMNFTVTLGFAQFAFVSQEAVHNLTTTAVHSFRLVVEICKLLPSQFNASESSHQRFLLRSAINDDLQDILWSMWKLHRCAVPPLNVAN